MTESNATLIIKSPVLPSGNIKNNISFSAIFSTMPHRTNKVELDQVYYWTKDWQEGEGKADKDIMEKNWNTFSSAKDAIGYLHKLRDDSNKSD